MAESSSLLEISSLSKSYGATHVLSDISLTCTQGEFLTIVGPSGCGKSTLLKAVIGQVLPTEGTVLLDGIVATVPDKRRGIVYQKYSLFPHLTVLQNVALGIVFASGHYFDRQEKKQAYEEAHFYLEKVGLLEHEHKFPVELSGGMQQRVAIAQALIIQPSLLLMDEPFGALDPATRESMQQFLLELWDELKMTIFFVTHDLTEAILLGTRLICLNKIQEEESILQEQGARIALDIPVTHITPASWKDRYDEYTKVLELVTEQGF